MSSNDGGQAFPMQFNDILSQRGMSLRDYFAGQAMAAYLVSPATARDATDNADKCAEWAYWQADAMLKAREATNG